MDFQDFTTTQLIEIAKQMISEREYELTTEAKWKLQTILLQESQKYQDHFSNARFVRNLIEQSIRRQAIRLLAAEKFSTTDLIQLTSSDIQTINLPTLEKQ